MAGQTVAADGVDLRIVQAGMTVRSFQGGHWRYVRGRLRARRPVRGPDAARLR